MSFENTGYDGTFHAGLGHDFTTRNKSRSNDPFCDDENHLRFILKVKTAQAAQNMRSRIQRRLDNDPFFRRMNPTTSRAPSKPTVTIKNSPTLYDATSVMTSCIGATLDFIDFLGHTSTRLGLDVALPKLMGKIGIGAGFWSIYDNFKQIGREGFNWNDILQIGIQIVIVWMAIVVSAGGSTVLVPIVSIGGMALFAWELAETHFGW